MCVCVRFCVYVCVMIYVHACQCFVCAVPWGYLLGWMWRIRPHFFSEGAPSALLYGKPHLAQVCLLPQGATSEPEASGLLGWPGQPVLLYKLISQASLLLLSKQPCNEALMSLSLQLSLNLTWETKRLMGTITGEEVRPARSGWKLNKKTLIREM